MFRLYQAISKNREAARNFAKVVELSKEGHLLDSLKLCETLVAENPYNVYYRHKLATLQQDMGRPIDLPFTPPELLEEGRKSSLNLNKS